MSFENYNKKIIDIMNDSDKIEEKMQLITGITKPDEPSVAFIPAEANFQLPNIFLRTRKIPECTKFFTKHANKDEYNNELAKVLEDFIFENDELEVVNVPEKCNDQVLMDAVVKRY